MLSTAHSHGGTNESTWAFAEPVDIDFAGRAIRDTFSVGVGFIISVSADTRSVDVNLVGFAGGNAVGSDLIEHGARRTVDELADGVATLVVARSASALTIGISVLIG